MNGLDALTRWLDGRRTLVVGLGKSGAAAATLLSRCGARVAVTESRPAGAVAEWTRRLPRSVIPHKPNPAFIRNKPVHPVKNNALFKRQANSL